MVKEMILWHIKRSRDNPIEGKAVWGPSLLSAFIAIILFSTLTGCATTGETSAKNDEDKVYIDYAKKKDNLPNEYLSDSTAEVIKKEESYSFDELVALGDSSRVKGNYPLSLTYFQKALALEPESVGVHRKIGDLFFEKGMPKDALKYYLRVLETHADFVPVHESLGQVYLQLQQVEEAKAHFLKAVALNPSRWKAHAYLGIIYDMKGNHIRAILEHKGALALNPTIPELYNNLGVSYSQVGEHDKAIKSFQKAIQKGAEKSQVYNNLGLLLTKKSEFPKALEAFHQGETDAKALNNVGVTMFTAGYVSEAIVCFERALDAQGHFYKKASDNLKRAHKVLRQRLDQGGEFKEIGQSPCNFIF